MKTIDGILSGKASGFMRTLALFSVTLIIFLAACTKKPQPYSILEFEGKGEVNNYSRSLFTFGLDVDSITKTCIVAAPGDLIMYDDSYFFTWRDPSLKRFSFRRTDSASYINDKVISIMLPEDEDMIPWFQQMNTMDLSQLEFLVTDSKISESYLPYLEDLAKIKPDIGLYYSEDFKDLSPLLGIFNPRIIIGGNLSPDEYNLLSGLTNLEILCVTLSDSLMKPLPALPRLRQLNLMGFDYYPVVNRDFLVNNSQLEILIIMTALKIDFSILKPLANFKELVINGCDSIENFDLIKDHKQLEVLVLYSDDFNYYLSPDELSSLRWISFPPDASQIDFDSFISTHPGLEVVEISNNKIILSLSRLANLKKLYGLTISDTLTDFNTLKSLENLKYLSLPEEVMNDSLKNEELKKALPDTRLVATHGACLGSGWLLLIIPLVLLFSFIFRMKYGRTD